MACLCFFFFFFQAEDGIRDGHVTGVQTCALPIFLSQTFSNIIRAEGKSSLAMRGMMIGSIINIILDPIFIFTFGMGVTGAAVATVLSNMISSAFFIRYLLSGDRKSVV